MDGRVSNKLFNLPYLPPVPAGNVAAYTFLSGHHLQLDLLNGIIGNIRVFFLPHLKRIPTRKSLLVMYKEDAFLV
ncbi:hypothetical protein ES703_56633 [subsurface metagenome]